MGLIHQPDFRDRLRQLPLLDVDRLVGHRQIRLAHLQVVTLVSGYVWCHGDSDVPRVLPKNLAVPFFKLSEKLGMAPGIGPHVAVALCNYKMKDPNAPLNSDNMHMLHFKFVEDYGNDWFFLATIQVELEFAAAVTPLKNALLVSEGPRLEGKAFISLASFQAAAMKDLASLRHNLHEIRNVIENMERALGRMGEKLKPDVFFNQFRFYLAGTIAGKYEDWGGLILEGVSDQPFKLIGGSAAQAAPIQCLDALLQIEHQPKSRDFLLEMRKYMLRDHRRFIEEIEKTSRVRRIVIENALTDPSLKLVFDECVNALVSFRNRHIQIVTKYILVPKATQNSERGMRSYKTLDDVGTGGTGIMPFLKNVRDTTKECVLE